MLFRIAAWGVAVGNEQMNLVIIHAYVFGLLDAPDAGVLHLSCAVCLATCFFALQSFSNS